MDVKTITLSILIISFLLSFLIGVYSIKYKSRQGALSLTITILFEALWSFIYIFELFSSNIEVKIFWENVEYISVFIIPFFAYKFSLDYFKINIKYFKKIMIIFLMLNIIIIVYLFAFDSSYYFMRKNAYLIEFESIMYLIYDYGLLYYFFMIEVYVFGGLALLNFLKYYIKEKYRLFKIQAILIMFCFFFPYFMGIPQALGLRFNEYDNILPYIFGFSNIFLFLSIYKFKAFNLVPIARSQIFENMHDGVCIFDNTDRLTDYNPTMQKIFEQIEPNANIKIGDNFNNLFNKYREEFSDVEEIRDAELISLSITDKSYDIKKIILKDKSEGLIGYFLVFHDISQRKKAERILKSSKLELEENIRDRLSEIKDINKKLRLSQKLESLGRLSGGIAHDFNNILMIILGNLELVKIELPKENNIVEYIDEIYNATISASKLTSQLLAFSKKQAIQPKVVNLNNKIQEMNIMLKRAIGEDIEIGYSFDQTLGNIFIDPGNIEQIILNLAINSRDAMPNGGILNIKTRNMSISKEKRDFETNITPGEYIVLTISDTGIGMTQEVKDHLFEPFFSTKGHEKGTGLGLSTIYGIVKQNRGFIDVDSQVNGGTKFILYFPRVFKETDKLESRKMDNSQLLRGNEKILLIEDDNSVRSTLTELLQRLGYKVSSFMYPAELLKEFRHNIDDINLVITDVIMPIVSGKNLANILFSLKPDLKILYMSGYTGDQISFKDKLAKNEYFLQKPFQFEDLSRIVREILDSAI